MRWWIFLSACVFFTAGSQLPAADLIREDMTTQTGAPADSPRQGPEGAPAVGFQLGLFYPTQLFDASYDVYGLRLNLINGRNRNVRGLDIGLYNEVTDLFAGVQLGCVNRINDGNDGTCMLGILNTSASFSGAQFGFLNLGGAASGFQLGLFNMADSMHGLQIGLLNFIFDGQGLLFCPIANARF